MICPLCNLDLDPEQRITLENDYGFFVQKPQAVLEGSGLIIPKRHRETVFELTKKEWEATYELLQEVKKYLEKHFQPEGYNIGWNCGSVGGQEIFHAHLHIIPRFKDEPLAGKGIRYWLKQPSNRRGKR
ncbi:MAG TPA: HIT family protein [Pseudoneobacillus sp.]|nr:HIT family protein [Pseudoneobacillus sp.]